MSAIRARDEPEPVVAGTVLVVVTLEDRPRLRLGASAHRAGDRHKFQYMTRTDFTIHTTPSVPDTWIYSQDDLISSRFFAEYIQSHGHFVSAFVLYQNVVCKLEWPQQHKGHKPEKTVNVSVV